MARGGKRKGSGRKSGSANKINVLLKATLSETAKLLTLPAMQTIADIMTDPKATAGARAICANSILDRGWGKASQSIEHTGKGGGPIEVERTVIILPANGRD